MADHQVELAHSVGGSALFKPRLVGSGEVLHAPKYEKGVPPREYAAMLLMRADTTVVRNVGIRKFGVFYSDSELGRWVNRKAVPKNRSIALSQGW